MSQHPIPVVIISSLTDKSAESAIQALEYGAVSVLKKPVSYSLDSTDVHQIIDQIKAAAKLTLKRRTQARSMPLPGVKPLTLVNGSMIETTQKLIAIGASTGGTEAILKILQSVPVDSHGILIVQHMPEVFTKSFAARLNSMCKITVKEAQHGDSVIRGTALIAPGNQHMILRRSGSRYYVELTRDEPVNRHRPSVDVLFGSVAEYAGKNATGVILTGMGADGAEGLLKMKNAGANTIAQDEESCVVFGMPREAIRMNAACKVLPLDKISLYVN